MKQIALTQGKVAIINDRDFALVSRYRWSAAKHSNGRWYAQKHAKLNGKDSTVTMHRMILGFPPWFVDHRNRNGLDNRRGNLRRATNSQNVINSPKQRVWHGSSCASPLKGVFRSHRKRLPWRARIVKNGKRINLGSFATQKEAANAYRVAAKKLFGQFAL